MAQPVANGGVAPGEVDDALGGLPLDALGVLHQPLGGVAAAVEEDVLDALQQVGRDVLVHHELAGIDDAHVQTGADRVVEEGRVHRLAHVVVAAEAEAEVGDTTGDVHAGAALLDARDRREERLRELVVLLDARGNGQDVRVEDDVLGREADLADEQVVGTAADLDLALGGVGLPQLVEGHHDDACTEAAHLARLGQEVGLALLEGDRVDDTLALDAAQAGLDHRPAGAVDHHRDARDLGLGRHEVEEARHRVLGVEQVGVHVDVEQVGATAHLLDRHLERGDVVVGLDQPAELGRAGDVGALANHHEARVRRDRDRLEPGEAGDVGVGRDDARLQRRDGGGDRRRVLGACAAAAAGNVEQAARDELAERAARVVRRLVVAAEGVRQTGVGMARDEAGGDARQLGHERPHLLGAESAVDAHDQRVCMLHGQPERLDGLPAERAAREVGRRHRDPERQLRRDLLRRHDRRLRVERVEDRLDQQDVDAAVAQAPDLLGIRGDDLIKGVGAEGRVVDLRRQRQRHVERADIAGHEARPVRRARRPGVGRGAGQAGALHVHVVDGALERVVGLPDRRRGEGVRRRDVGASREVRVVDLGDDLRLRQVQQVGVALDVVRVHGEALAAELLLGQTPALQQHAPGAIEHEHALAGDRSDAVGD